MPSDAELGNQANYDTGNREPSVRTINKKKLAAGIIAVALGAAALSIGLGVGLTRKGNSRSQNDTDIESTTHSEGPITTNLPITTNTPMTSGEPTTTNIPTSAKPVGGLTAQNGEKSLIDVLSKNNLSICDQGGFQEVTGFNATRPINITTEIEDGNMKLLNPAGEEISGVQNYKELQAAMLLTDAREGRAKGQIVLMQGKKTVLFEITEIGPLPSICPHGNKNMAVPPAWMKSSADKTMDDRSRNIPIYKNINSFVNTKSYNSLTNQQKPYNKNIMSRGR